MKQLLESRKKLLTYVMAQFVDISPTEIPHILNLDAILNVTQIQEGPDKGKIKVGYMDGSNGILKGDAAEWLWKYLQENILNKEDKSAEKMQGILKQLRAAKGV